MPSQWDNFFKNIGIWNGAFIRLQPDGTVVSQTPSRLSLERTGEEQGNFQLTRYPAGQAPQDYQADLTSLMQNGLFLADGSFSKGPGQWRSAADFGAEFSLLQPDARLRLVQIFKVGGALDYLVLIPETREGIAEGVRPTLSVEQLSGTWQGEAIDAFPDGTTSEPVTTGVTVTSRSAQQIDYGLQFGEYSRRSQARLDGSRLLFERGELTYQLLLLPNGGSALCPQTIIPCMPFVCELGWLVTPHLRLRLVRQYKADGSWSHSTWIREEKVA